MPDFHVSQNSCSMSHQLELEFRKLPFRMLQRSCPDHIHNLLSAVIHLHISSLPFLGCRHREVTFQYLTRFWIQRSMSCLGRSDESSSVWYSQQRGLPLWPTGITTVNVRKCHSRSQPRRQPLLNHDRSNARCVKFGKSDCGSWLIARRAPSHVKVSCAQRIVSGSKIYRLL